MLTATQEKIDERAENPVRAVADAERALVDVLRKISGAFGPEPRPYPDPIFRKGVPPEFGPFFESGGKLAKLADALKAKPYLFWHPMVLRIIRHLQDIEAEYWSVGEDISAQIRQQIRQLIEAAASGLLGGTWGLKPPPGRPGRKRDEYLEAIELELRDGYEELQKSLKAESLQKQRHESQDQCIQRVATLVKEVWIRSSLGRGWEKMRERECPPPPMSEIVKWVRKSFEHRTETGRPVRSQLAWKMLAYRYGLEEGQVRGRLDAVRKQWGKTAPDPDGFVPSVCMPSARD
jgi:hypothetical protein